MNWYFTIAYAALSLNNDKRSTKDALFAVMLKNAVIRIETSFVVAWHAFYIATKFPKKTATQQ